MFWDSSWRCRQTLDRYSSNITCNLEKISVISILNFSRSVRTSRCIPGSFFCSSIVFIIMSVFYWKKYSNTAVHCEKSKVITLQLIGTEHLGGLVNLKTEFPRSQHIGVIEWHHDDVILRCIRKANKCLGHLQIILSKPAEKWRKHWRWCFFRIRIFTLVAVVFLQKAISWSSQDIFGELGTVFNDAFIKHLTVYFAVGSN